MIRVLIADDHTVLRHGLRMILNEADGIAVVGEATDGEEAVAQFLLYFVPGVLIAGILAFNIFRPIQVLPRVGLGPGFGLIDTQGERVTNETQWGKLVLYSFTYTHCEADCPRLMEKMREVWQRLDEIDTGDMQVELVTISIDPERDTPDVMAEYAASLGVPPGAMTGASACHSSP